MMIKPGIKFLREQADPHTWYVLYIDKYAGVDYHGMIYKLGGHWYFTYPEVAERPLTLSATDILSIENFISSLKRYGPNGMFEYPTDEGYETGSFDGSICHEDDWAIVENAWKERA